MPFIENKVYYDLATTLNYFSIKKGLDRPEVIGVAKGRGAGGLLDIQLQFLLAFSHTIITDNYNNVNGQGARAPSIQIFVNQLQCKTWKKF